MRVVFALVSLLLALTATATPALAQVYRGHAVIRALFNSSVGSTETPFEGYATFVQNVTENAYTTYVSVTVRGLQAAKVYGVHIHQWGDISGLVDPDTLVVRRDLGTLSGVGGHYDVLGRGAAAHNCAPHATRHTGDLGNISVPATTAPTDWASFTLTSELLDLGNDTIVGNSIIGRGIVIHELPDNCVQLNVSLGNWIGVGVIGIDNAANNTASQENIPVDPITRSPKANALIYNSTAGAVAGNVWFWSDANGGVHMSGLVRGFEPNTVHGVHIHEFGNVFDNVTIGAHFGSSAINRTHALPPNPLRHWGDLGNLKADGNGVIVFNDVTAGLELISIADVSKNSIIGRSIAFHDFADDGTPQSFGPRHIFGVIGLASAGATVPSIPVNENSVPALAHAVLRPFLNSTIANLAAAPLRGTVDFEQSALGGPVTVTLRISGLQAKTYGVHVHTWGDLSGAIDPTTTTFRTTAATIASVGGHFDALGRTSPSVNAYHSCAPNASRHTGDLGNITVPADINATTVVTYTLSSELLDLGVSSTLFNDSIVGRAIVIHELPDICYVPQEGLGGWVSVGIIGLSNRAGNAAQQDTLSNTIKANVLIIDGATSAPRGDIQLSTDSNGVIRAYGVVGGFAPSSTHGFHVHVWGNEDTPTTSGPHYSQYLADFGHSLPPSPTRHWGDLGNVTADGVGNIIFNNVEINADLLSLWNATAHGIIGRTLMFHAAADNGFNVSSYGGRIAYGVVGLANPNTVLPAIPTAAPVVTAAPTTVAPTVPSNTTNAPTTTAAPSTAAPTTGTNTTNAPTSTPTPTTNTTVAPTTQPTTGPNSASSTSANLLAICVTLVMAVVAL